MAAGHMSENSLLNLIVFLLFITRAQDPSFTFCEALRVETQGKRLGNEVEAVDSTFGLKVSRFVGFKASNGSIFM